MEYIFYFILILYFLTQQDVLYQDIGICCTVFTKNQFFYFVVTLQVEQKCVCIYKVWP